MTRERKTVKKPSPRRVSKSGAPDKRRRSAVGSQVRIARVQAQFTFAARISALCDRMSLPELAARLGVSMPTLYRWRSALTAPHRPHRWLVERVETLEQELGL